jgi:acyl-CoA thioesterase FadM/ketosteroid isomerase-like protein
MIDLSHARTLELSLQALVEPRFLDGMGHMNVAWYLHLFDQAMWPFFGRHGLDETYLKSSERGMFGLEDQLRYLSELREGDGLEVYSGFLELRAKTLRFVQYMVDTDKQKVAAVREVVAAHIDLRTRRSTAFEPAVMQRLQAAPQASSVAGTMTEAAAQQLARAWIGAWNRLDFEAVLSHYAEDAVFISPKAERFVGRARIEGKVALRSYWQTGLAQLQRVEFTLYEAIWSARAETLTVVYRAKLGSQEPVRAVEIMQFRDGQIIKGEALYGASNA